MPPKGANLPDRGDLYVDPERLLPAGPFAEYPPECSDAALFSTREPVFDNKGRPRKINREFNPYPKRQVDD